MWFFLSEFMDLPDMFLDYVPTQLLLVPRIFHGNYLFHLDKLFSFFPMALIFSEGLMYSYLVNSWIYFLKKMLKVLIGLAEKMDFIANFFSFEFT